jgi:hypothetical protein
MARRVSAVAVLPLFTKCVELEFSEVRMQDLGYLEPRRRDSRSEPQPRRVGWSNILEVCIKMRFLGCSTTGDESNLGTDSLGIKEAEFPAGCA